MSASIQFTPSTHYMLDLLDMHRALEETVSKETILFKTQSSIELKEIERLENEREATLKKHAEEAAARSKWSALGTVAQYLGTGASIAVGLSLGPATWAGGLLLASGVVGLGSRAIHDTVGWNSIVSCFTQSAETQKIYVRKIEGLIFYFELGTGLAGGAKGCYDGAFALLTNRIDMVRRTIGLASHGMKATSQLGKSCFEKQMSDLQAKLKRLEAESEWLRMEMNQQVTDTCNLIETAQLVGREMHKTIAGSEVVQD